jgi:hypothetical protein
MDAPPSGTAYKNRKQDEQGERGSGLREDQRIDRMKRLSGERNLSDEDATLQRRRHSPEKGGRGDEEISAQGMGSIGCRRVQDSGTESDDTESDDGVGSRS